MNLFLPLYENNICMCLIYLSNLVSRKSIFKNIIVRTNNIQKSQFIKKYLPIKVIEISIVSKIYLSKRLLIISQG